MKKWAFDPKNTKNHVFGVKHPYFHLKGPVLTSGMMTNQFWDLFREKKQGCSTKKWLFDPQNTLKMHFSPESLQNRFTFGHILSREVTWSIKNHMVQMVIEPWPGIRTLMKVFPMPLLLQRQLPPFSGSNTNFFNCNTIFFVVEQILFLI